MILTCFRLSVSVDRLLLTLYLSYYVDHDDDVHSPASVGVFDAGAASTSEAAANSRLSIPISPTRRSSWPACACCLYIALPHTQVSGILPFRTFLSRRRRGTTRRGTGQPDSQTPPRLDDRRHKWCMGFFGHRSRPAMY